MLCDNPRGSIDPAAGRIRDHDADGAVGIALGLCRASEAQEDGEHKSKNLHANVSVVVGARPAGHHRQWRGRIVGVAPAPGRSAQTLTCSRPEANGASTPVRASVRTSSQPPRPAIPRGGSAG